MNFTENFLQQLMAIERFYASFYEFSKLTSISEHLIGREKFEIFAPQNSRKDLASTLFLEEGDNFWVGVYFHPDVIERVNKVPFEKNLDDSNLQDFLILAEEVSHFHFVLNRMDRNIPVTRIEIEMQGEIDKWIISSHFLKTQSGKSHERILFQLIFEHSTITAEDVALYEMSTKHAHNAIRSIHHHPVNLLREKFREIYFSHGLQRSKFTAKAS